MWEPANPTERADFEEDLIASTNERLYQRPVIATGSKLLRDQDPFFQHGFFDREDDRFDRRPVTSGLF